MSVFRQWAARRTGLVLLTAVLAGGTPAVPVLRAQIKADAKKPLQYDVSVTLKLVQVYVSGKNGSPVGDLNPSEFEVYDNGRIVPVTHFEKHFLNQPEEVSAGSEKPKLGRKFFLLFDFAFIDPRGVLRAKAAGLHFIDTELRHGDQVGLLTYTAFRGLVLHEYLTTDHKKIRRVVDGFGLKKVTGRAENLTDYVYSVDVSPDNEPTSAMLSPEEQFFQRQAQLQTGRGQRVDEGVRQGYVDRVRAFIDTLSNLAVVLRTIPGYKNFIVFSGGVARQVLYGQRSKPVVGASLTAEDFARQLRDFDAAQADTGLRDDFSKMVDEFKAANSPIYALDVSRSVKDSDVSFSEGVGRSAREFDGADSLRQMASGSGGRFFANTMDYKDSLADIQNVTGSYYVLGYSVSEKWDGKFHRIKVRVNRKGCDVAAQGGYFDPKPYKEYSSFEKLIHVTDLALSEEPQFQVPEEIPVSALPVTVDGTPRLLAFSRVSGSASAEVLGKRAEAYLLLCDEKGDIAAVKRFRLTYPEPPGETYFPSFLVAVKPGSYVCRMVLRNMDTGRGARGFFQVVVPEKPTVAPAFDSLLLLAEDPHSRDLAGSEGSSPSNLFGYDQNSYAPLVGDVPSGLSKLFAALRCSSGDPNQPLELSATLGNIASAGHSDVPVSVLKKSEGGLPRLLFLELATGELKPGRYTLTILAKGPAGESVPVTSADFVVK